MRCVPMERSYAIHSCYECPYRNVCTVFQKVKELEAELEELAGAFGEL